MFKKNDLIIIGAVLVLAAVSLLIFRIYTGSEPPAAVEVRVDGKLTAQYPLHIDREFTVSGYNGGTVNAVIQNGKVDVVSASCPDKICVDHRLIFKTGESIVCLPSRVVITLSSHSGDDSDIDAVSGN